MKQRLFTHSEHIMETRGFLVDADAPLLFPSN